MSKYMSWGRYPYTDQKIIRLKHGESHLAAIKSSLLPFGLGRSYGDSCLNSQGVVLSTEQLQHFIRFDSVSGVLRCEAGIQLGDIIDCCLPYRWFLPVTPGTKYVTVAGAVANDVHGKNHHSAASFGRHVMAFELLRSDGSRLLCSRQKNADWFYATIGGLGLTGLITWVEMQLKPVTSQTINAEIIKYKHLDEFFLLAEESASTFEYTAAWIDCLASGDSLGKGHFIRGNHADIVDIDLGKSLHKKSKLSIPMELPASVINRLTLKAFNTLYYERQRPMNKSAIMPYDAFFYPLDGLLHWNRLYGKKGFLQHQSVIPFDDGKQAIRSMLALIAQKGMGSILVVMKTMGDIESEGLLSFPMKGITLALDFPMQGEKTLNLLDELDVIVKQAQGRVYPAKDARMSASLFQESYPKWEMLEEKRDPVFMSDFWHRVTGIEA